MYTQVRLNLHENVIAKSNRLRRLASPRSRLGKLYFKFRTDNTNEATEQWDVPTSESSWAECGEEEQQTNERFNRRGVWWVGGKSFIFIFISISISITPQGSLLRVVFWIAVFAFTALTAFTATFVWCFCCGCWAFSVAPKYRQCILTYIHISISILVYMYCCNFLWIHAYVYLFEKTVV